MTDVFANINGTFSSGVAPAVVEYYDRKLIPNPESSLIHYKDMQKKKLPLHNGKTVQMNKFHPLPVSTTPLREGVTPEGKKINMSSITFTVKPYGDYVPYTDELDLTTINSLTQETAKALSTQAEETLDAICADAMAGGLNVFYCAANGATHTSRTDIVAADILDQAHIKKIVRTLEKNKAKRFPDGYYHCIVDPETKYDLTNCPMWVDVAKYQNSENFEKYELGKMLGVKFFETTQTKVVKAAGTLYDGKAEFALNGGKWDVAKQRGFITVAANTAVSGGTEEDYAYFCRVMSGKAVRIMDGDVYINALIDRAEYDDVAANIKMTLRYLDATANWTYASGDKVCAEGAGNNTDVHISVFYGQDFAGAVELGTDGGAIKSILNAPGSAGANDPLAQRGTIGWKMKGFAAGVIQDVFGVRAEHAVSE